MVKLTGNDIRLYIGGYDLGGSQTEGELFASEDEGPVTAINDTADRVASLKVASGSLTHAGFFEDGTNDIHDLLRTRVGSNHVLMLAMGTADEKPSIHGEAMRARAYSITGRLGDFFRASGSYVAGAALAIKATAMAIKTTFSTFPVNDGIVDDGASSTAGAEAVLQVFSVTGGTSITVTINHSTDNFAANDVVLITFTVATGRTAERVAVTGTVNRYRRIKITQAGGVISAVIAVSFQRN